MPGDKGIERLAGLVERQIAIQLYFAGVNQQTIARVLQKSKGWVNTLLQSFPKPGK